MQSKFAQSFIIYVSLKSQRVQSFRKLLQTICLQRSMYTGRYWTDDRVQFD